MKIVVLGAGAMGSIYGGYLSQANETLLVDVNADLVEKINREGVEIEYEGRLETFHPKAATDTRGMPPADLVMIFMNTRFSKSALDANRGLIGKDTCLMTLQNGAGHETLLRNYADDAHIIIGTTEDNGTPLGLGKARRGGVGVTNIGMLVPDTLGNLPKIADAFRSGGFDPRIHEDIRKLIWDKLFTNVSLSALTAVLQVDMGFIAENAHAWEMARGLIHEAVLTANAIGVACDEEAVAEKVRATSLRTPQGVTSIRRDLAQGRKTEVDTISGAVVAAARDAGIPVPRHEFIVRMVHAMEERP